MTDATLPTSLFPSYPDIVLVYRRPEIFAVKEVVATEKLHGSNFRINFPLGMTSLDDIRYGSHDTIYTPGEKFALGKARDWFLAKSDLLANMWEVIKSYGFSEVTVFGEAFGPGIKAKGVRYSEGQEMLFRAFNIMVAENFLTTYELFVEITDKMGLPRVPEVWRGAPTQEAFDALLEKPSVVAGAEGVTDPNNLAEGVVIFSNPMFKTATNEWLIVKHKGKKFSEVAHAPKERVVTVSPFADFATTYVTEGRIRNAIGRLQDRGVTLDNGMKDMPILLEAIVVDLNKECGPELDALGPHDGKGLLGAVSRTLGPLYRTILAEPV